MVIRMVIRIMMVSRMVIRMVSRMVILWLYGVLEGPHLCDRGRARDQNSPAARSGTTAAVARASQRV